MRQGSPEDYDNILTKFTWVWEGGGRLHKDAGGLVTRWGLAQIYHPTIDVATITEDEAKEYIYNEYWMKFKCDKDTHPNNIVIFEIAFNPGAYLLYRIPQGFDWKDLIIWRLDRYMDLVAANPAKIVNLQGWNNRTMDLYQKILRGEL